MNIKLTEILWEITSKCNRSCKYCGSSDIINNNKHLSVTNLVLIAENISEYMKEISTPKNVTFTGGEPLTVDVYTLSTMVTILHDNNCSVSLITNGDLLNQENIKLFDNIGISVNVIGDMETILSRDWYDANKEKITFITNFGTHNIFEFDNIVHKIQETNGLWQIQLTMGEYQLDKNGIKYLYKKINNCEAKYVLADNLQMEHTCMAGIHSMGITYNGYVVPCISKRAWSTIDDRDYYGCIINTTLKNIWEGTFKDIRFRYSCSKCDNCRNHIDYPENVDCTTVNKFDILKEIKKLEQNNDFEKKIVDDPYSPNIQPSKKYVPPDDYKPDIFIYAAFPKYNYEITCQNLANKNNNLL